MAQSTKKSFALVPRACFEVGNIAALVSKADVVWEIPAMSPSVSFKVCFTSRHTLRIVVTEFMKAYLEAHTKITTTNQKLRPKFR